MCLKPGPLKRGRSSQSTANTETQLQSSQEIQESHEPHGCHRDHARRTCNLGRWCCVGLCWNGGSCSYSPGHHRVLRNTSPCSGGRDTAFQVWRWTLPVQFGDDKTWIEAFAVPDSTPHLISRLWLSQHRCLVNFDPNKLCLESSQFGSVPLMLDSSGHLPLSLVNPPNTLDQYTVVIDCQNSPSGVVNGFQKRDEQTTDSSQPRDQVVDKRAEPDEERAADSSMVLCVLMSLLCLWVEMNVQSS